MSFYLDANEIFIKLVIAAMVVFLSSELIAIFPIYTDYEKSKKNVMRHLVPIWEITGTMIVFFVVELELIYSTLTPIASYLFIPVIGAFVIFLILRNVAIIYAEFIWKKVDSKPLYMFYSAATFIMVIGFVTAVAALMVGVPVHLNLANLPKSYVDYSTLMFSAPYSAVYWEFVIGTLSIAYGMSQIFYRTVKNNSLIPLVTIIIGLILDSGAWYTVATLDGALQSSISYSMIIPVIFTLAIAFMYYYKPTTHLASYKPLWFVLMTFAVFSLEIPITKIAGGAYPINYFASTNSMQAFNFYLSILGGIIYLLLMVMYAFVYNSGRLSFKPETEKKESKKVSEKLETVQKN